MRTYIVIPEGAAVLRVDASAPQFAINKARRGKGDIHAGPCICLPASAAIEADDRPAHIPGQLRLEECA